MFLYLGYVVDGWDMYLFLDDVIDIGGKLIGFELNIGICVIFVILF